MPRRYDERGLDRYGERDDDDTAGGRDYGRVVGRGGDYERNRYGRGSDYGALSRGLGPGRDYDDYGSGGEYARGGEYDRGYGPPRGRDYTPRYGREGMLGGPPQGRGYGRDYGREYVRERERGDDDDDNRIRSYDTDYGRTTSRFYGRSGYEYGRDDYEPYGERRRDDRDDRDERGGRMRGRGDRGWWDRAADEVLSWFGDDDAVSRRRMDGSREGRFRGRGPKNYRRSDERIRDDINDRLTDNDWLDASDVEVNVLAGDVTLTGAVDSRYAKRLAEDIASSVTGVSNVQNNLRVHTYQSEAAGGLGAGGGADTAGRMGTAGGLGHTDPIGATPGLAAGATTEGAAGMDDDPPTSGRSSRAAGRG